MKKFLLMLAMMLPCLGAWAQEPVLELNQIGAFPYELSDEEAAKVYALTDLTIAVKINTASVSGRMALFATSDPTIAANSDAEGKNSRYVAYGMNGSDVGYLASWRSGDRFTAKNGVGITSNKNDVLVVYVVNPTNNTFKCYVNAFEEISRVNAHNDGFMSGYEIATPKMVKTAHPNAKIYIGGGKHSGDNGEVFNGTITSVKVYNGALTQEQIAAMTYSENDVVTTEQFVNGNVYTFKTSKGWMGARETDKNAISTALTSNNASGSAEDPYFQWSVYKSEKGNYYIYNIGKGMFLGEQSTTGNSTVPMSETPAKVTFKATALGGYPLMFKTTDNNSCSVNHSDRYGSGLITWNGGWDKTTDAGNCHLITKIADLDENVLTTIKNAVDAYEADNTEAVEKLLEAIATMETWVTNNVDEGVGKYHYNSDGTFEAKIQVYKDYCGAITQKNNPTPAEVEAKIPEVQALRNLFAINQPETGKFYRLKNYQSNWYATSDVYTSGTYKDKLYMANENNTARTVWFLTADKKFLSYDKGQYMGGMTNNDWSFKTIGSEGNVVTFNEAGVEGKYQIIPSDGRALFGDQVRVDAAGTANKTGNYAWILEEVEWLPVPMNTVAGYATLYSPVQLGLNGRVKAYTATVNNAKTHVTLVEQSAVPANVGIVLEYVENAEIVNGCVYLPVQEQTLTDVTSDLKGTFAKTYVSEESYVLSRQLIEEEYVVGFYKADMNQQEGASFLNNGFKAYLPATQGASLQVLRFNFGGNTTAIESVVAPSFDANAPIYDLSGRRVVNAVKGGLYIQNGKKFIVR